MKKQFNPGDLGLGLLRDKDAWTGEGSDIGDNPTPARPPSPSKHRKDLARDRYKEEPVVAMGTVGS